ncbi:MAG: hypothetical protein CVT98_10550 [Bacteroidetes bacterium HGW-Bacteroidetes-15]|nr:MAG: hypothetical protein CVT98_10550 [Bacteroidetes bacterium HGW-Bacteroidetes-15]
MENVVENDEINDVMLSRIAIENLKRTMPWIKFISILGFVLCGLMVLAALAMLIGISSAMGSVAVFASVLYLLVALLMFYVNKYLFDYANGLKSYFLSKNGVDLDVAFDMQRKFWKLVGIITIVYIGLIVLTMILFAAFAAFAPF